MTDETPAQAATPEPQAGDGKQVAVTEPEQLRQDATTEQTWTLADALAEIKRLRRESQEKGRRITAAEKAQEDAARKAAEEQGQFKELYEKAQAQAAKLEADLKAQQIALLRQQVATAKKLPQPLADRLRGETLDELNADADELLQALPRPAAASLNGGERGLAGGGLSTEDARQIAGRFNINPRYLED